MKLLVLVVAGLLVAPLRADSVDAILGRMDQAAKAFKSVAAKMHRVDYTKVIDDKTEEDWDLRFKRGRDGVIGVVNVSGVDARTIGFHGKTIEIFYPKANSVQIIDASKYAATIDEFLLLGFGTSGAKLRSDFEAKTGEAATIDSTPTTILVLLPKAADVKKIASKIELWIPEGKGSPIQEKVTEPSGNYHLGKYSDTRVNPNLPDSEFELKLPPGVKKTNAR